jgi:uncharacterized protein (UPF0335 family)
MQEIPQGMASVNGRPPVPVAQAVEEVVDAIERKFAGRRAQRGASAEAASAPPREEPDLGNGIAADRLRSIVDRIERLEEEKKALSDDIKDIFAEAKSAGFDVKALRQIIRMRKWGTAELEAHEELVDLYRRALGM